MRTCATPLPKSREKSTMPLAAITSTLRSIAAVKFAGSASRGRRRRARGECGTLPTSRLVDGQARKMGDQEVSGGADVVCFYPFFNETSGRFLYTNTELNGPR